MDFDMQVVANLPSVGGGVGGKKYLFVTHAGAPGGAEFQMLGMCKKIAGASALMLSDGPLMKLFQGLNIPVAVISADGSLIGIRREDGIWKALLALPGMLVLMFRLARFVRHYDVLVPMSQKSFVLLGMVRLFVNRPIIWYMNDLVSRKHFSRFMIKVMALLARFSADHVILNSRASRIAWIEAGGIAERCTVSYPGVDADDVEAKLRNQQVTQALREKFSPDGKPLVAVVGRLSPWKGQDVFIRSLTMLPDVVGLIVGDALFGEKAYQEKLRLLVEELGLKDRVIFAGHREDIPNIMAAADVVVHCSTAPEPFGLVIVEAMMSGTPVVASNEGGPLEIIINEGFGILTTPGDEKELAVAMARYLRNRELSLTVSSSARERAMTLFSFDAAVDRFHRIVLPIVDRQVA